MTKLFTIIFSFLLAIPVLAQNNSYINTFSEEKGFIYLKDGTVLKGKYLYSSTLDKVRVVSGKETRVIDTSEIEKISKLPPDKISSRAADVDDFRTPSRFLSLTQVGVLAGNSKNERSAPLSVETSLNYLLHKNFSAGLGVGIDFLNEAYLPVSANVMCKFLQSNVTPYAVLQGGYMFNLDNPEMYIDHYSYSSIWYPGYSSKVEAKGGWFVNPSVGLMIRHRLGYGFSFALGYRYHKLKYAGDNDYNLFADYNRLSIKVGVIFN